MTLSMKKDCAQREGQGDDEDDSIESGGVAGGVRRTQRVPLTHNSLIVMGVATNARWMYSVHTIKRLKDPTDPTERGPRISLTFRHIGTFLTPPSSAVGSDSSSPTGPQQQFKFGQGATGKARTDARLVAHRGERTEQRLAAFGAKNHQSELDWDKAYGEGFDVLHFATVSVRVEGLPCQSQ